MNEEESQDPPRTFVGGVDLTNTDLAKPFFADFSVPNTAAPAVKREALAALRLAFEAISERWSSWYYADGWTP
jgi:hypothetical protein